MHYLRYYGYVAANFGGLKFGKFCNKSPNSPSFLPPMFSTIQYDSGGIDSLEFFCGELNFFEYRSSTHNNLLIKDNL